MPIGKRIQSGVRVVPDTPGPADLPCKKIFGKSTNKAKTISKTKKSYKNQATGKPNNTRVNNAKANLEVFQKIVDDCNNMKGVVLDVNGNPPKRIRQKPLHMSNFF